MDSAAPLNPPAHPLREPATTARPGARAKPPTAPPTPCRPSPHLCGALLRPALAAERQLRPYVGELAPDPMLLRSVGRWQEIPHPSRFVRERSEIGARGGALDGRLGGGAPH